ncbi:hypothetical protein E2P81_ATG01560 [Venturia nashicola]|uniref:Uncharacterized protein n=1 Tax=Venturia nashicola TaxID=86259 RepID=A0A4Z1NDV1_9PEZI|nr:hypothetical protein E6O75_ATG01599 [Venturia nashicola]TLD18832.1 hypothetical protein E2P81_ATG01560 [Venturia nashicola]
MTPGFFLVCRSSEVNRSLCSSWLREWRRLIMAEEMATAHHGRGMAQRFGAPLRFLSYHSFFAVSDRLVDSKRLSYPPAFAYHIFLSAPASPSSCSSFATT